MYLQSKHSSIHLFFYLSILSLIYLSFLFPPTCHLFLLPPFPHPSIHPFIHPSIHLSIHSTFYPLSNLSHPSILFKSPSFHSSINPFTQPAILPPSIHPTNLLFHIFSFSLIFNYLSYPLLYPLINTSM